MPEPEFPAFTAVTPHYDRLMRDVPYRAWVRYLKQLLEVHNAAPVRVLDLACGTGTASELLHRAGYTVVGVDLSPGMIAEARRKAKCSLFPIEYHVQNASTLDIPGPAFDLCVSFFDSVNYINVPKDLQSAFIRVAAHLKPGGLFVFDINSAFALENGFFDQENTNTDDVLRYVWRSEYEEETRLCRVHMRFFLRNGRGVDEEFREEHIQFAYTEQELRDMLDKAGFGEVATYHAYSLSPVRESSDRIFFVARKVVG
jgi:ubiquinone/menaquinone biosynthesis C-methylase UbiE